MIDYGNLLVGSSNFIGIIFLLNIPICSSNEKLILLLSMISSAIYHFSEMKNGLLKGIGLSKNWEFWLLQLDRFFAIIAGIYILDRLRVLTIPIYWYIISGFGIFMDLYSDRDIILGSKIEQWEYIFCHCIWHFIAFWSLSFIIKLNNI